jgi:hypothetical protein
MRRVVVVAVALVALGAAPTAQAEETIGSLLPAPTVVQACAGVCSVSPTAIPGQDVTAPFDGVITRWRVRMGAPAAAARLLVIRRPGLGANEPGELVARSQPLSPAENSTGEAEVNIPIGAGDHIGLECCDGAGAQVVAGTAGASQDVWLPALAAGVPALPLTVLPGAELLVNADIEPDVDGDEAADETRDNCVSVANFSQADRDRDGRGDACDTCPDAFGPAPDGCPPTPPATPRVNTPPVVRFRTPVSGTMVRATQAIELDVSDDAGNPTVTLFDDDGTICTLTAPPYACTWTPTGADVGRATLLASAVDSDNRSTLGIVRVRVARFTADLTRRVRGRRVTGRLVLPAAVERSLGCRGRVTVRRSRTSRKVALKRNCTYSARLPRGRGRVRARFAGNPVVEPAT